MDCRTLFATHFHSLASTEFCECPRVALGHMAALVNEAKDGDAGSIVFLYELQNGACPKSYGLQVRLYRVAHSRSQCGMHRDLLYLDDCPRAALGRMAALVKEATEGGAGYIVSLYELHMVTCPKSYAGNIPRVSRSSDQMERHVGLPCLRP